MYKISVPVINWKIDNESGGREKVLAEIKRLGAERVFLAIGEHITDREEQKVHFEILKENCRYFKEQGFEVGAWIWTFTCDSPTPYTKITGANGQQRHFNCPMDENFVAFVKEFVSNIGKCGVDLILLDDDFRFGHLTKSINCTCPLHMARIREILQEEITPEELKEKALTGGRNKYRDAWMQANGESLMNFAKAVRAALDEETPHVRLGNCSSMSTWGNDGVNPEKLTKALSGKTKPFMRLTGAPYWAVKREYGGCRLHNIIEFARMQRSMCSNDIEVFGEGDVFPRPRHNCPSAYLELFDMGMRADGNTDGILKYAIDYVSQADYETGYIDRHCKNKEIYKWIEENLSNKEAVGVRVYEHLDKFRNMRLPEIAKEDNKIDEAMFSPASKMLADCTIPTVYDGMGICGAAFAENINFVPEEVFKKGMIIDIRAAEILQEKGIDTGLISKGETVNFNSGEEYFEEYNEHLFIAGSTKAYKTELNPKCRVLSQFIINKTNALSKGEKIPAAYLYENEMGYRFFVYTFDAYFNNDNVYRSYARSKQLKDSIKWLSGESLPAYSHGNPDLYIMAKKDKGKMAVGLWNDFEDSVLNPVTELDGAYELTSTVNCTGRIEGNKVYLSEIMPYSFVGFEVEEKGNNK